MHSDEYPCPCEPCDSFAMMEDEYCTKCMHHGCSYDSPKCPDAQRSHNWCDYCHSKAETVPARPDADENRICGDCYPSGSLPDRDNWWEPEMCGECGEENPFENSVSCSNCGFIPPEHRA